MKSQTYPDTSILASGQQALPGGRPGVAIGSTALGGEWTWVQTPAGAAESPAALDPAAGWLPAPVPGTVASALRAAGRWDDAMPPPLHQYDHWYRVNFAGRGRRVLRFNGLATVVEAWLNGKLVLSARHMFVAHEVEVDLDGDNLMHLCFRALHPWLRKQRGPVRWKPRMIVPPILRAIRTTLLGHMPGWCPPVHAVGPWRPVELLDPASDDILHGVRADLWGRVQGDRGVIGLHLHFPASAPASGSFEAIDGEGCIYPGSLSRTDRFTLEGTVCVERPKLWWPHTHGEPHLYRVDATIEGRAIHCGRVGFRTISLDCSSDAGAFALRINGEPLFCRGACISSNDLHGLADTDEASRHWLELARRGGMNMVRISGVTCYPGAAFYRICDELGLLVWHDFMFANFDYGSIGPGLGLTEDITREVGDWLSATLTHPSIAVLCGGSEAEQQAAMMGVSRSDWKQPLFDELIRGLVAAKRPDVVYVGNSPTGGAWPFQPDTGVSHYYGVGAYQRPLADARLAQVRFASECLAFANVPCERTLAEHGLSQPLHSPRWKATIPRDAGAPWDFEDVREYYLRTLYEVDPPRLRYEQPQRYLVLSRAVVAEVMTEVFSEWRRVGSSCAGGLIWQLQDLVPGAGWGIVDACGRPKSAWHALRQVWQPLQVLITDEGLNGLHVHAINETPQPHALSLTLRCLRDGETVVAEARHSLLLPARGAARIEAAALLDRFFDFTYAYRFGPPTHDVVVVTLHAADSGEPLSQAVYLPDRRAAALKPPGLRARLEQVDGDWWLTVSAQRFARWVHIDDHAFQATDNWFHLAPGSSRRLRLVHEAGKAGAHAPAIPSGEIHAVNAEHPLGYDG
ncbi:Glycoside hydrolase family 2 protein [Cupriavidus necator]|uniref:beta-mannosidase n=1 Tax=Cupriavidus necator (strain ATCC 17699 / DSM 428 / KCTC 22496 / NCIMB 10442 / H16 / Stanier 337) TaxID=381666 RepID=Q0K5A2_CUPNH|nr:MULTISPECIES: glycoside hydrolase family 2 protein [Cupriavidus]EON19604.1 putative beta-mannosidase [Cupriavidus sp. GA3-3]QCC02770.1 glycoside hydrolase family 2 protein [Cupriavidus necator H16]QQB79822.1 glycoside hydrolase family 2 protein [Cupriavidus necator]WKA44071.1 glycoside hydrolase family 2 protein [Cupriavidus necator]CAJ94822.1 putative beta-mannosidase [Cupriavidus necator H16]